MTLKKFRKEYPACFTFLRDEIIEQLLNDEPYEIEENLKKAFEYTDFCLYDDENYELIDSKVRPLPKS